MSGIPDSGIDSIRNGSESFEYLLNVPTVIKHSTDAPVFYMNSGECYEFSCDMKEFRSSKTYFKVQLGMFQFNRLMVF